MAVGIPLGPYRLVRRLAAGGMAEIFLARQEGKDGFRRDLVVKRILPHLAADPEFARMFREEARLAPRLSHPNVVHIYDFGSSPDEDGGETYWLAMELVRGVDLRALIGRALEEARSVGRRGAIPAHHAAKIGSFVCEALAHAHSLRIDGRAAGVVHRDLSPSNVLVSFDGAVKLADFGIAKAMSGGRAREETGHGVVKGKHAYLSPEQARGEPLDARSDLFNVGILLFEAIAGEPLFPHEDHRLSKQLSAAGKLHRPERIDALLPPAVASIVKKALSPSRGDRQADALALRAELEAYLRTCPEPSDAVELGAFVRYLFPDAVEEDARGARAAGTVPATGAVKFGTKPMTVVADTPRTPSSGGDATRVYRGPSGTSAATHELALAPTLRAEHTLAGAMPRDAMTAPARPRAFVDVAPATERHPRSLLPWAALGTVLLALVVAPLAYLALASSGPPEPPDFAPTLPAVPPPIPAPSIVALSELRVRTEPAGLDVWIDGELEGRAPLVVTVPGDSSHTLETRDGDRRTTRTVTVRAGEPTDVLLDAPPPPPHATLRVESEPAGASVRIDGAVLGVTPLDRELPPSAHTIELALDGHEPASREITLGEGERSTLSFALRRVQEEVATREPARGGSRGGARASGPRGYLTIASTPWSEVYEGSRHLGTTPLANVELSSGVHVITLRAEGRPPHLERVTIRAGEVTRVRLAL